MSREDVDLTAPLPLGYRPAVARALEMRTTNPSVFSYPTIAAVMARYHGIHRSAYWWREKLHEQGVPLVHAPEDMERARRARLRAVS